MSVEDAKEKAEALHQEAMDLDDAGDTDLALKKYLEALQHDLSRATTHYNIGLIYKYRHQWPESFRYNKQAVELDPDDEAANWNLAIAATALRDWQTARSVWHRLGMPVEEGDTPIAQDFGMTPVRLDPDGDGEVVWGRRIDPVRVRILSIPMAGFRHGDIVLHDGAAVGHRDVDGRRYPVFNVLEPFEASAYSTWEAEVHASQPEDIEALEKICDEFEVAFEDWTTSVQTLCRACSEGTPHDHHDTA
ncbi:MAG: Tetratricopeptide 2 repeat protein, partial [Moraxellaceae bacterium]|nr:Tetratricopeptide 2 repeat protein [Moraxellaceae bacterium]